MILVNYGEHPCTWDELRKERLQEATKKCFRDLIRNIDKGLFRAALPDLQAVCLYCSYGGKGIDYLHAMIYGCTEEQAKQLVTMHNSWKPVSWGNFVPGPFFTTDQIMLNVDVVCGPVTDLFSRYTYFYGENK